MQAIHLSTTQSIGKLSDKFTRIITQSLLTFYSVWSATLATGKKQHTLRNTNSVRTFDHTKHIFRNLKSASNHEILSKQPTIKPRNTSENFYHHNMVKNLTETMANYHSANPSPNILRKFQVTI